MSKTSELIQNLIDNKPVDFAHQFGALMQDRISSLVGQHKVDLAQTAFAQEADSEEPEVSTDAETEDEGETEEQSELETEE